MNFLGQFLISNVSVYFKARSHFRLGPPGPEALQGSAPQLAPALTLQLDKFTPDRQVACYNNGNCARSGKKV